LSAAMTLSKAREGFATSEARALRPIAESTATTLP
jgi:hypothetical protein